LQTIQKPRVIVYRDHLLPSSETFIRAQGEGLRHFVPFYMGLRSENGLPLPPDRTYVLNHGDPFGYCREYYLKFGGLPISLDKKVCSLAPALIHAHFGRDAAHILPLARAKKLPFFVTFHGWDATAATSAIAETPSGRRYLRRRDELAKTATRIIAVSQFIANCLEEKGFPKEKIVVHYIGVDTLEFVQDPKVQRKKVVLFVGRLVEKKGCEFLIRAMKEVQIVVPDAELVVIGDGPLRKELEQLAAASLFNFAFLGTQPASTVRSWMNRAKIFCVPSLVARSGDAEGFGIVFIEAQALGTPVVSFASGGVPEAVAHGATGFLAPERDWRQLAKHIVDLLLNQTLWNRLSTRASERARSSFDLRHQCLLLEGLYSSAIASNRNKIQ
jgi:colanic acid/amylovoran biosynthesis glycosyltransferase